jgi:hypothetical protein
MQAMNKRQLVGDALTYCEQAFNVPPAVDRMGQNERQRLDDCVPSL